jgi:Tol biopolymer transport system component
MTNLTKRGICSALLAATMICWLTVGSTAAAPPSQAEPAGYPSPDGVYVALVDRSAGSLTLRDAAGADTEVFPAGSTVDSVTWSPDSRRLLAVRTRWLRDQDGVPQSGGGLQVWQVELPLGRLATPVNLDCDDAEPTGGLAACLYQSPATADAGPEQLVFGRWSPDSRHVVFWRGPLGASLAADGLPAFVLAVTTGQAFEVADIALLTPHYHSWSPGGTTLVMTAGGDRSALLDKRLVRFDVATGLSTTLIEPADQVPGAVAWSPTGEWLAYAAVDAAQVDLEQAHNADWDNPGIAGRRIYLLQPDSGLRLRVSGADAFQDGPHWSADGATLYFIEREGDVLILMAYSMATANTAPLPVAPQPLPETPGYYGQLPLDALLVYWPVESRPTPTPAPPRGG